MPVSAGTAAGSNGRRQTARVPASRRRGSHRDRARARALAPQRRCRKPLTPSPSRVGRAPLLGRARGSRARSSRRRARGRAPSASSARRPGVDLVPEERAACRGATATRARSSRRSAPARGRRSDRAPRAPASIFSSRPCERRQRRRRRAARRSSARAGRARPRRASRIAAISAARSRLVGSAKAESRDFELRRLSAAARPGGSEQVDLQARAPVRSPQRGQST